MAVIAVTASCTSTPQAADFTIPDPSPTGAGTTAAPTAAPVEVATEEEPEPDPAIEICVRRATLIRVAYQYCDDAERGYAWYYLTYHRKIPAVGRRAAKGTFKRPNKRILQARVTGGVGSKAAIHDKDRAERLEVCVRTTSRIRVPDGRCEDADAGFGWYYIKISERVPAVGRQAEHGSFRPPGTITYRADKKGGAGTKAALDDEELSDLGSEESDSSGGVEDGWSESDSSDSASGFDSDFSTRRRSGCSGCSGTSGRSRSGRR
ncbi:hypothetical protein HS048_35355 [Planomonospora sp. ID91781]|uniref:hypothetical protein n=1 Tax=Planomonospora sp. ID91781 TaxID=2738135 RepID=UPI0018C4400E|nr:hypothetical protein [Planomonospora sp. ID91781]MBG0825951.1 hypothetical protein [Planomonospora sp. ID91781]